MRVILKFILILLIPFISCRNNPQTFNAKSLGNFSGNIVGNWLLRNRGINTESGQTTFAKEFYNTKSTLLRLQSDSSFQMDNAGFVLGNLPSKMLSIGDIISGSWYVTSDSLILIIPYKEQLFHDSYKIHHCDGQKLVIVQKQFEVESYKTLQFSRE
ncbi:MAG TPA: hypothetical protein VGQ53_14145 [Chitinophagaceae bacterium]|nr:hypothetical protein [Chitinophagaceae bacterium]